MGKHSLTREEAQEVLGVNVRSPGYTLRSVCAWLWCRAALQVPPWAPGWPGDRGVLMWVLL